MIEPIDVFFEKRGEENVSTPEKSKKGYDWRYENSIRYGNEKLILSEQDEKYNIWRVISILSNHPSTVFESNIANMMGHIPHQMHYDYLFYSIRKQKTYSKKQSKEEYNKQKEEERLIQLISDYYKYNITKSKEVLKILSKDQLEFIRIKQEKGGVK